MKVFPVPAGPIAKTMSLFSVVLTIFRWPGVLATIVSPVCVWRMTSPLSFLNGLSVFSASLTETFSVSASSVSISLDVICLFFFAIEISSLMISVTVATSDSGPRILIRLPRAVILVEGNARSSLDRCSSLKPSIKTGSTSLMKKSSSAIWFVGSIMVNLY